MHQYSVIMRGFLGFAFSVLLPALFVLMFGFAALQEWRNGKRHGAIAVMAFVLVLLAVAYTHMRIHYDLWALKSSDVREISVAGKRFTDRGSIDRITSSIKSSEWYSVEHGGWGDETPIVFDMASGQKWQMMAAYHFAQHGAVVLISSESNGHGWRLGEVFSLALPDTLEQLGVPLSKCDTVHGHPCP